ncbi:MAG: phytanoyl-CoA dioxygenase, partial [Polaromonas sp.]|nr:phytanoyl-CoA dioxygenase [Polaromonas sp.]
MSTETFLKTETQTKTKTADPNKTGSDPFDTAAIMGGLYGDGFIACKGAFERGWVRRLGEDIAVLFDEARRQPGGLLARGPNRFYVEIHPERLRGFADIVTHPWVVAVSTAVLGPDYRVVEAGFDVPGPGALRQPWHRDFASPPQTLIGRRLNSLAFNITTVDVTDDMGPLEIAPGTQWDDLGGGDAMFPLPALYPRYEARRQRKLP